MHYEQCRSIVNSYLHSRVWSSIVKPQANLIGSELNVLTAPKFVAAKLNADWFMSAQNASYDRTNLVLDPHANYWHRPFRGIPGPAFSVAYHLRRSPRCSANRQSLLWPSTVEPRRTKHDNSIHSETFERPRTLTFSFMSPLRKWRALTRNSNPSVDDSRPSSMFTTGSYVRRIVASAGSALMNQLKCVAGFERPAEQFTCTRSPIW